MIPPQLKNLLVALLMMLFGVSAVAYLRARRRWVRRIAEASAEATPADRDAFMASAEYRALRNATQRPILVSTFLFLALYLLMRFG